MRQKLGLPGKTFRNRIFDRYVFDLDAVIVAVVVAAAAAVAVYITLCYLIHVQYY
jgi:hypothetical protein